MPESGSARGIRLVSRSDMSREIGAFLVDRQARGKSPETVRWYGKKLSTWRRLLESYDVNDVLAITPTHVRRALVILAETHNPGGVHGHYRALRAFLLWYEAEYEPGNWRNPINKVKVPTPHEDPLPPVAVEELAAMLATCTAKSLPDLRDKALLLSLLDTGCRASEFVALDISDLDTTSGAVAVQKGKGNKSRVVFLGAKSLRAVLAYLRKRGNPDQGALFATLEGGRLTYSGLRGIVSRRARAAGVAAPSLHSFRRAFALACLRNGVDLISLQRMLGHADLSVIRRYLAQTTEDLQAAHRRGGPVDRLL